MEDGFSLEDSKLMVRKSRVIYALEVRDHPPLHPIVHLDRGLMVWIYKLRVHWNYPLGRSDVKEAWPNH